MGEASKSDKMQEKVESLKRGLARCQVCGEEAEIVFFGARGEGVWFGESKTSDSQTDAKTEAPALPKAPREVGTASYASGSEQDFSPMPDEDLPF